MKKTKSRSLIIILSIFILILNVSVISAADNGTLEIAVEEFEDNTILANTEKNILEASPQSFDDLNDTIQIPSIPVGGTFELESYYSNESGDMAFGSDIDKDLDVVDAHSFLTINNIANATHVGNNTLVEFTIIVNNTGAVNATGVWIRDGLPDGFDLVNATEGYDNLWNCWVVDDLPAGKSAAFTLIGRSVEIGNWTNYAYTLCDEDDNLISDSFDVEVVPVVLTINKTANVTRVGNNTLVEFTIIVNNACIVNATDVRIKDGLPSVFDFVNATEGYDYLWSEWNIDVIPAGKSVALTIVGRANEIFNYTNYAYALCNENDTLISDTFKGEIVPANLTIVKCASQSNVTIGGDVTFEITITNNGPIDVTDVHITDELDNAFKFDSAGTSIPCIVSGQKLLWNIGNLASKESKTISFNVTAPIIGNFTNVATVTCSQNTTIKSSKSNITVNPASSLVEADNVDVDYGDSIVVLVTCQNATSIDYVIADKDGKAVDEGNIHPGEDIAPPSLPVGNYTVELTTVVDDSHTSSTYTSTIEVKKTLPPVNVNAPTITVGNDCIIIVTVPENATGSIIIEVEGKTYTAPVKKGKSVFIVQGLKVGLHDIKAYYSGDDNYLLNNATGTIEVLAVEDNNLTPQKDFKHPLKTSLAGYETANPIVALLVVLALLGIITKRRK
ncbi:Ig-like domain repeat protein [Methanobrevibacter sp.]|uniref:Ig-like domain repeat protein n=1 Tax=Methanobrevibacter sp. TaxID=66852 RepID=UPI00386D955B